MAKHIITKHTAKSNHNSNLNPNLDQQCRRDPPPENWCLCSSDLFCWISISSQVAGLVCTANLNHNVWSLNIRWLTQLAVCWTPPVKHSDDSTVVPS